MFTSKGAPMAFAVCRHAHRADTSLNFGRKYDCDADRFPLDPPLSSAGLLHAERMGMEAKAFAEERGVEFEVVFCSPYYRCVQTAIGMMTRLGGNALLAIDPSLGEVYGPDMMGGVEPQNGPLRPIEATFDLCAKHGVAAVVLPTSPASWPEDRRAGCGRVAASFLEHLRRGLHARRSFVVVTHAHGVDAALTLMPSEAGRTVRCVEEGAMFFAEQLAPKSPAALDLHRAEVGSVLETMAGNLPNFWRLQVRNITRCASLDDPRMMFARRVKQVVRAGAIRKGSVERLLCGTRLVMSPDNSPVRRGKYMKNAEVAMQVGTLKGLAPTLDLSRARLLQRRMSSD